MFLRFLPFVLTFVARKLRKQQTARKRGGSTPTGSRTATRRPSNRKAGR